MAKKLAFLTQNKDKKCKNLIITLVFEKNANFVGEKWQKSQKILISTSTRGRIYFALTHTIIHIVTEGN
jgi:hypothetical protein